MCWFKFITGLFSENSLEVNVLTSRKDSWNLQKNTFIRLFHHTDPNSGRKNYFQSDMRLKDCLITHWLPATSILVVIERIYRHWFKSNYLKNDKFFARFSFSFTSLGVNNFRNRWPIRLILFSEHCKLIVDCKNAKKKKKKCSKKFTVFQIIGLNLVTVNSLY